MKILTNKNLMENINANIYKQLLPPSSKSKLENLKMESNEIVLENGENLETNKKYRHNRYLRQEMINIERTNRKIQYRQNQLDKAVRKMEKQMETYKLKGENPRNNEIIDERIVERVRKLEETDRLTHKQIFNLSRQISELNRLHLSMLQLLESVENLETKVDDNVPELQREISKMEFNMAQATSSLSIVKETQTRTTIVVVPHVPPLIGPTSIFSG
ncbi:scabrous protein, putative [Pediculus humanus corporis]|uniref:Scabrous protein, putative n=1 Tax=Pediculus humanus subsp. corporis TaxID=121224 RepID=E0VXI5_PEDHC|nr:scabrous protein, putative [Pediculus humanus corporis]EEB18091.1 scabrous protein, putative [Pediculus humanus corporis]